MGIYICKRLTEPYVYDLCSLSYILYFNKKGFKECWFSAPKILHDPLMGWELQFEEQR